MTITFSDHSAKLRTLANSLIAHRDRRAVYEFVRDGHVDDVATLLGLIEARQAEPGGSDALLRLAWMLIESRGIHGDDDARERDKLAATCL